VRARERTTADAILAEADAVDARVIVLGTRGLTGVKSVLLGSVSHAVLQHADRPVVVVPSAEVAKERAAHRR
jgi:nucleotide-binding universal stress UspA family protein